MIGMFWRLTTVFGSALVLMFFSEFFFINESPVVGVLNSMAEGWIGFPNSLFGQFELAVYYALFSYAFLITLDRFSVRTWAGLYLAGSIFGWAAEATVVPAAHEAPPVSWFFPSATWHPIVDAIVGWYLVRHAMRTVSLPWLALIFSALGAVWAYWATWYWSESDPGVLTKMSPTEFDNLVAVSGTAWIIGMILTDLGMRRTFRSTMGEVVAITILCVGLLVAMGIPFLPWSAGIIVLIGVTILVLWRAQSQMADTMAGNGEILAGFSNMPRPITYGLAALTPMVAAVSYRWILAGGISAPTDMLVGLIFVTGTAAYFWSLWRVAMQK